VITLTIEIIFGLLLVALLVCFFAGKPQLDIFTVVGIGLVIIWIAIMVVYYSWAIYFYNVNLGLTDRDWQKIENSGNTDPSVATQVSNPEKGESLGLPSGTVRATIALSILVGGLALFIASLGRNNVLKDNQVFVDYFDFFKSAFLMMIAFYFGGKSLETLVSPKAKKEAAPALPQEQASALPDQDNQSSTGTI
jgi:hypothetical protein